MTQPSRTGPAVIGPKVTVVIPAYNMAGYLPQAIGSVLAQSWQDYELLVLDNASTDGTPAVLAGYHDPRIRAVRNATNLGLAGNVQRGCAMARGEYLVILGADDRWLPGFLAQAVAFLEQHGTVALLHGPAAWIDAEGRRFGGTKPGWARITPGAEAMLGAFSAGFCFATMVMRRAAVAAAGPMDQSWQEVIDLWLFLRLCLAGDVGYLDGVWCEYRVHEAAMSMPMYRDNLMFRRQMAAARECFAWPGALALGAAQHRPAAERAIARIAVDVLHLSRGAGRRQTLRNLTEIIRHVPGALLWPRSWARLAFALLPADAIRHMQRTRRRRALAPS